MHMNFVKDYLVSIVLDEMHKNYVIINLLSLIILILLKLILLKYRRKKISLFFHCKFFNMFVNFNMYF